MRDTVKLTVTVAVNAAMRRKLTVSIYRLLATFSWILIRRLQTKVSFLSYGYIESCCSFRSIINFVCTKVSIQLMSYSPALKR